ncbi:3'-5' exoribonuclease YhaM family protein [Loigolactobacillus backii]|uniref:3'-5' exonuclease n=1 Tax=Loigolactobacillus backii TaxID=375175 RepID=A0A192H5Q4_9LACO|nr:OB-fold nucleic acid binding domain-containing protein [Loigolactobacillus backii]ANK60894.1 3'-5' exonuclease [Loigolactobacillus backii]ANK63563.1 3'-5' exonuclease [Loigolactobacillus backii]ANK65849.1 3'-5' exonuclease [Loigolactobacillus backii]ANK68361.1 3'-5' exonuclease [Loigolactobacillus backii]ANK70946.1 3'-5' exonuclease [Loigolactobacillus backii]
MAEKKLFDYQNNENVALFVVVKGAEVRLAKNGKKFIAFTFEDSSGQITAKFWDASETDITSFQAGKVVYLTGKRELYQGKPQIKLFKLRLAQEADHQTATDFLPKAPLSKSDLEQEINQAVFAITNPNWNRIVRWILQRHQTEFFDYPAAKTNHHAFEGGLAFHTVTMLHLAQAICAEYSFIKQPLLYAGIILHDMGKTIELSGAMATTYTLAGNLLGHIVLIDEEIVRACTALKIDPSSEELLLLRHVILAHHGRKEYGSPVEPEILEAEVLHHIDDLDASIMMLQGTLEHTEPGNFSERIFGMDGRHFYRPEMKVIDPKTD